MHHSSSGRGGGKSTDQGNYKRFVNTIHKHGPAGPSLAERERMSVFDRLGTKRGGSALSSGGGTGSQYSSTEYSTKGKKSLASSVVPVRRAPERSSVQHHGHGPSPSTNPKYDQDKYSSRGRSFSPKYKRGGGVGSGVSSGMSGSRKVGNFDKYHHKKDIETRNEFDKAKFKGRDREGYKHIDKNTSSSKLKKQRAKLKSKISRAANSSTDSTSKGSSTSKSESTSTSASDISSTSQSDSSSSESSAPSIKLKSGKGKRSSGGVAPSSKDKRGKDTQSGKKIIGSSSSSIVSAKYDYKSVKGTGRGTSPQNLRERDRDYMRDRDFEGDKRRMIRSSSKTGHYSRSHDSGSIERDRGEYTRRDHFDPSNRKRKHSVESYGSGGKRSRQFSPSPGHYKNSTRHTSTPRRGLSPESSHGKRRYTPESQAMKRINSPELYNQGKMRRDRSPQTMNERVRIIKAPDKRSFYDQDQRRDIRYGDKPLEMHGRQFSSNFEVEPYDKDKRPRERLAPARSSSPGRGRTAPPPPHQNFEAPTRRAPLLPFPPGVEMQRFGFQHTLAQPRRDFPSPMPPMIRPGMPGNMPPHLRNQGPLIVKTKEALIQKYEVSGRQSRVDMWVDETIGKDPNRPPLLPTPSFGPYQHPPTILQIPPRTRIETKPSVLIPVQPSTEKPVSAKSTVGDSVLKKEKVEAALSDFSDDAEELLNEEVEAKDNQDTAQHKEIRASNKPEETESKCEQINPASSMDNRDMQSNAGTHTDDDILERLDFEEISDDELGETESKVGIIDALGVDWASLISTDKTKSDQLQSSDVAEGAKKKLKLSEKWCAANRFKMTGLPRKLFGEVFFNKIYEEIQAMEEKQGIKPEERTTKEELEFPSLRRKRLAKDVVMRKLGLVSSSTAYTRHRDEALRRFLVDLPPEPPGGLIEIPQNNFVEEDEESDLDIFQKSIALLKGAMVKT